MTTRILLVRHGQPENHTPDGIAVRMSGWTDVPLSERGRQQAICLAARLGADAQPLHALYSSPLRRALTTADYIAPATSLSVEIEDGLKEINCGSMDGLPIEEVRSTHPQLWCRNMQQTDDDFRWPGGESYREFRERCFQALSRIAFRHSHQRVVVVTHAGVIGQVFGALHENHAAQWESYRPGMTSVSEVIWRDGPREVLRFDDRQHLTS